MEYLVKDPETGKYWETTDKFERNIVVEIPEGAELLTASGQELIFWKDNGQLSYHIENSSEWDAAGNGLCDLNGYLDKSVSIVWQCEKVEVEDKKLDIKKVMAEAEMFDVSNREHGHYYKDVSGLNIIDPYMVLKLFNVTDPCLQHIVKKALVSGGRGYKDFERDLKDIHDTSKRALEINNILH